MEPVAKHHEAALIAAKAIFLIFCFNSCTPKTTIDISNIPTDSLSISNGQALFNRHCITCHQFNQENKGPSLGGLTTMVAADWIKNFIRSPITVIESGDDRAQRLIVKYNELMPAFDQFSEDEINDILGFLHTQKSSDNAAAEARKVKNGSSP